MQVLPWESYMRKYLAKKKKNLYFGFVELKKAFDQQGPWDVRHT